MKKKPRHSILIEPFRIKGFTIIEMCMVIVIVAILAGLAIPKFDAYYDIKLGGTARKLMSDIRYAQRTAIAKHEDYGVDFDTTNHKYRVYVVSTSYDQWNAQNRACLKTGHTIYI